MPKLSNKKTDVEKKVEPPSTPPPIVNHIPERRYETMLVGVCGWRINLQEVVEYLGSQGDSYADLAVFVEACLEDAVALERQLAESAVREYPRINLPRICINR